MKLNMMMFLAIFKFLVGTIYYWFLWNSIFKIKEDLFDKDKKDRNSLFWLDFLCVAYAFFNCGLIIKALHL